MRQLQGWEQAGELGQIQAFVDQIMQVGRIKRDEIIDAIIPKRVFKMHSKSEARKKSQTRILVPCQICFHVIDLYQITRDLHDAHCSQTKTPTLDIHTGLKRAKQRLLDPQEKNRMTRAQPQDQLAENDSKKNAAPTPRTQNSGDIQCANAWLHKWT